MKEILKIEGTVNNSQFMYDAGHHELTFKDDWQDNKIDDIIDCLDKHIGKKVKITIEVEE